MGPIKTLDDVTDMLRRRARLIVQVIAVGWLVSGLYALSQQHIFSSTEVIQIAFPDLAETPDLSGTIEAPPPRLQLIQQRLTTRTNMLEIIDGFGLYAENPDLTPDEMVERLRQSVRVDGIADDDVLSILSITADMPTARQAQLVAHEVARRAIGLSTTDLLTQTRAPLDAVTAQEDILTARVFALEDQIAALADDSIETKAEGSHGRQEIERQYLQLQADLDVTRARRTEAEIGFRLQSERLNDQLMVIEPASLPGSPITGSRGWMALLGGSLSVIVALALAVVLEVRSPVIRTARQMERETGIVPVVTVPYLDATPPSPSRWHGLRAWFARQTESGSAAT